MRHVAGAKETVAELNAARDAVLGAVAEALEKTAVRVATHARSGHESDMAHAEGRYQNQTTTLTRSIQSRLTRADYQAVEAEALSNIEYAEHVEGLYPFMLPALQANREVFVRELTKAIRRVTR